MASTKEISDRVYENLKNEVTLTDRQKFEVLQDVKNRLLADAWEERKNLQARLEFLKAIDQDFNQPGVDESFPTLDFDKQLAAISKEL